MIFKHNGREFALTKTEGPEGLPAIGLGLAEEDDGLAISLFWEYNNADERDAYFDKVTNDPLLQAQEADQLSRLLEGFTL